MSHDLKTPLNSTQLMLYNMKDILKNSSILNLEDVKSTLYFIYIDLLCSVNDIISNNLMLIFMINDLLDYS